MTHRAAGASRGIPRIWILPLLVVTGVLAAVVLGFLSRSLLLDVVAWWPVWLLLALAVVFAGGRRIGRVRVSGLVPVVVTVILVVFVVGHLRGWPLNPSASRYLAGRSASPFTEGSMTATIDGDLVVRGGSSFLYEVTPLPGGGDIGLPTAEERVVEDSVSVTLVPPVSPGLDSSSGWQVELSEGPEWSLQLGGFIDADLTGLRVGQLALDGSGLVTLGPTDSRRAITVEGGFTLAVPVGVPARVEGPAQVPDSWEELDDGWRAPVAGPGWVISVQESSVVSVEQR